MKIVNLPDQWNFKPDAEEIEKFKNKIETGKYLHIERKEGDEEVKELKWVKILSPEKIEEKKIAHRESVAKHSQKKKDERKEEEKPKITKTEKQKIENAKASKKYREKNPTKKQMRLYGIYKINSYRNCSKEEIDNLIKNGELEQEEYDECLKEFMEDVWNGKYWWIKIFPQLCE